MQRLRWLFAIVLAISLTQMSVGQNAALADELSVSLDGATSLLDGDLPTDPETEVADSADVELEADLAVDVDLPADEGDIEIPVVDVGSDSDGDVGGACSAETPGGGGNGSGDDDDGPSDEGAGGVPPTKGDVARMPNTGTGGAGTQPGSNLTLLVALLLLVLTGARALDPIFGSRIR